MIIHLSDEERSAIRATMNPDQLDFLDNHIKRGRRNVFLTRLAEAKGIAITDNMTDDDISRLVNEWELVNFEDAGPEWQKIKIFHCECGQPLRYRYTVQHAQTGKVIYLSEHHFADHLGIPANVARNIVRGFEKIDLEQDEILTKFRDGWKLEDAVWFLPKHFEVPDEFKKQLELGLPLLERQIDALRKHIQRQLNKREHAGYSPHSTFLDVSFTSHSSTQHTQRNLSLLDVSDTTNSKDQSFEITSRIEQRIMAYLSEGTISARMICELLIRNAGVRSERYVTNKPTIYYPVCLFLDSLVSQGKATFLGTDPKHTDRKYQLNIVT